MHTLPPDPAYRLALLLSRERGPIEDQLIQAARELSPLYAFMPAFLLRHWCHEVMGAVLAALVEADLRPVEAYTTTVIQLAHRLGRSPTLLAGLVRTWGQVVGARIDAEYAADPAAQAEAQAILGAVLALAAQVIARVYQHDGAARELLQRK